MAAERTHDVYIYDIQYWMCFEEGDSWGDFVRVTEDKSFDPNRDRTEYKSQYLCDRNQKTRTTDVQDTYSFTIDTVGPGGIQQKLAAIENTPNVRAKLLRTCTWDFEAGKLCAADALDAICCEGLVNSDPLGGKVGELATFNGTFSQATEWVRGTFDPSSGSFAAD